MNRKALFVALIISAIVSLVLWSRIKSSQEAIRKANAATQQAVVIPKKSVVISTKRLPARTRLDSTVLKSSFKIKEIAENLIPEGAFANIASMTDRYTSVTILPDDIMTSLRLLNEEQVPSLALAIPQGKRAITITVSEATSVGGFIQQGDYVDIIATFRPRGRDVTTKLILQDIQVLAVGTTYEFDGSIATSTPAISANKAKLVTLALTPQETEKLMFLDSGISFRLILKNPNDHGQTATTFGITEKQVLEDIETPASAGVPQGFSEAAPFFISQPTDSQPADDGSVIVMQGAYSSREIFRYNGPSGSTHSEAGLPLQQYKQNTKSVDPRSRDPEANSCE
ncbi:Flp pilus assembly protein CpaB [bacterium]|nr:Flp pilus assembly protein CpaB [bacterium]